LQVKQCHNDELDDDDDFETFVLDKTALQENKAQFFSKIAKIFISQKFEKVTSSMFQ